MTRRVVIAAAWFAGVLLALALASAQAPQDEPAPTDEPIFFSEKERKRIARLSPLPAPPADPTNRVAEDPQAARYGQRLFFEKRFSANGRVSCATCHDPMKSFADGLQVAEGIASHVRHSPSLWNTAHNRWYFWDGRADSLWAQALQPLETPVETNGNRMQIVHLVARDDVLRRGYEAVFGAPPDLSDPARFPAAGRPVPEQRDHPWHVAWMSMSEDDRDTVNRMYSNLGKAIAAYERQIVSSRAPFDAFAAALAAGDQTTSATMSISAQRGLKLFIGRANCRFCHFGPNFSDGEFHNTGVPPLGGGLPHDAGRFVGAERVQCDPFNARGVYSDRRDGPPAEKITSIVSGSEAWGQFKTPSLRNVAMTAPYMHQGQLARLRDVIRFYSTLEDAVALGHHQETILKPLNLTEAEIDDLIAFLETLTSTELDPSLLRPPDSE